MLCPVRTELIQNYVGRPGHHPGALGLKGTSEVLLCVGLVVQVVCFHGNALFPVGLVSRCCRKMRPEARPVSNRGFALGTRICSAELETIWCPANLSRFRQSS
jgi:hypothetical protein